MRRYTRHSSMLEGNTNTEGDTNMEGNRNTNKEGHPNTKGDKNAMAVGTTRKPGSRASWCAEHCYQQGVGIAIPSRRGLRLTAAHRVH